MRSKLTLPGREDSGAQVKNQIQFLITNLRSRPKFGGAATLSHNSNFSICMQMSGLGRACGRARDIEIEVLPTAIHLHAAAKASFFLCMREWLRTASSRFAGDKLCHRAAIQEMSSAEREKARLLQNIVCVCGPRPLFSPTITPGPVHSPPA